MNFAFDTTGTTAVESLRDVIPDPKISVRGLDFFYGGHQALFGNTLDIAGSRVTAIIGPSGCGKSTHIRVYNRI